MLREHSAKVDTDLGFQRRLAAFNYRRLTPVIASGSSEPDWEDELAWRRRERAFVAELQSAVAERAAEVPREPDAFVSWFEGLKQSGPGQNDALFPWLAERASLEQMRWFLTQEAAGEAGFDDLVALTQVKLPTSAKLELARNYWDEMGRGHPAAMHGPMLEALTRELHLETGACVVAASLALGNLMTALAANRDFAFQSIGALGAIELTAPGRAQLVNAGLKRLGVGGEARRYFALHATLDVQHSLAWNQQVIRSLVAQDPATAPAMAEGALMRLEAGRRCFERYRAQLWSAEAA